MGGHARSSLLITAILAIALVGWPAAVTAAPVAAPGSAAPRAAATSTEWDETGFTTAGGFAPALASNPPWVDAEVVQLADGSLLLTYIDSGRRLRWERYTTAGALVKAPHLEVGVLDRPLGEKLEVVTADAARLGSGAVLAQGLRVGAGVSDKASVVTVLDADLRPAGPPVVLEGQYDPSIATQGDRVWVAVTDKARVYVYELQVSGGLLIQRHRYAVTAPGSGTVHDYPEIAVDGNRVAVAYLSHKKSNCATGEIRLAVLDAGTGAVQRDALITSGAAGCPNWRSPRNEADVLARNGIATVHWYTVLSAAASPVLGFAEVNLASGSVTQQPSLAPASTQSGPTWPLRGAHNDHEWVDVGGSSYLLGLDSKAVVVSGVHYGRFKLFRWDRTSISTTPIVLDGGFPIRADVVVELGTMRQNPLSAIVTRRAILEGSVINRGLKTATSVTVAVSVAGTPIGTLSMGTLKPNQRKLFAIDWIVADTSAMSVQVRYAVATPTPEYSSDNNIAAFAISIVQKGVIWGAVTDISADMERDSAWSVALEGATVCLSGVSPCMVSNTNGFFRWENLDFGTYSVTATRAGFKPMGPKVVTITRPKPIGYVGLYTDNHGILRLKLQNELGQPISGVSVSLLGSSLTNTTPSSGTLVYDLPAGTYRFAATKRGFWSEKGKSFTVVVGQDKVEPLTLLTATGADLGGQVFDRYLRPVTDATVKIKPSPSGTEIVAHTNAKGEFGPIRVPASPSKTYGVTATSPSLPGLAASQPITLYGGDVESMMLVIAPSSVNSLKGVSAIEGYTSWMVKASWPGFMSLPSAAMYVWYGNYIVRVDTRYWSDTRSIAAVDVTVMGGTYETHATTSEIDFDGLNQDYGDLFDVTKFSEDAESLGQSVWRWFKETARDAIDIGGSIKDLITGDSANDAVITGQGPRILTWKEAKSDIGIHDVTEIPLTFALPICISGSSVQRTSVRVDRVDLVDVSTRQVLWSTHGNPAAGALPWFNWQGPLQQNGRRYSVTTPDIKYTTTAVYVWLRVGKTGAAGGTPEQTAFEQRAEQVVIFRPVNKAMVAFIAPGDLYQNASMITYGQ